MKNSIKLLYLFFSLISVMHVFAQKNITELKTLQKIHLYPDNSVHFLSPQPIKYVDISTHRVQGDLPLENMLRIKFQKDSLEEISPNSELGTLTIVAEDFITQYRLCYTDVFRSDIPALIELNEENSRPIDIAENMLTQRNKQEISLNILSKRKFKPIIQQKDFGITLTVNQIYTLGDHMFLDISFSNSTNLPYDIDEFRFFIEDKKILKASNFQSLEIKPIWKFKDVENIKSNQRNIYVIKKIVFPGNKILKLSLTEKQISGRMIEVNITYKDVLNAQSI